MEPRSENLTMGEISMFLYRRTNFDINLLREKGYNGTIQSIPGINRISNVPDFWTPKGTEGVIIELAGSQLSYKEAILDKLVEPYIDTIMTYPSFVSSIDFLGRHAFLFTLMRDDINIQSLSIDDICHAVEAELVFSGFRKLLGIDHMGLPFLRDTDYPLLKGVLSDISRAFGQGAASFREKILKALEEKEDVTMKDFLLQFFSELGIDKKEELLNLSYHDQMKLFTMMRILFPEMDFEQYVRLLDHQTQEPEISSHTQLLHTMFVRELIQRQHNHIVAAKEGLLPQIGIMNEDLFSALLYYYTNIATMRVEDPRFAEHELAVEPTFWAKLTKYIQKDNTFHAVIFFFADPQITLARARNRSEASLSSELIKQLYTQQLAMYSRLLHAKNLPFVFAAVDASGTETETYRNFMYCFNKIMLVAKKDLQLA